MDLSYPDESAIGRCPTCGSHLAYPPHQGDATCPRCSRRSSRMVSGAVGPSRVRQGRTPGDSILLERR